MILANTDLYAVLEVGHDVSPEELKKAYRRLARQHHPDNNPGDAGAEAHFKEVSQAYEILSDPERRANYDRFGADVGGAGSPFGSGSVQDIFDMFFGGMGGVPSSGADPNRVPTRRSPSISRSTTRRSARIMRSRSPSRTAVPRAPGRAARRVRRR